VLTTRVQHRRAMCDWLTAGDRLRGGAVLQGFSGQCDINGVIYP
jgi:hypothetical protein